MLYDFLVQNQKEILSKTMKKTLNLEALSPDSDLLKRSLPIFYNQLKSSLLLQKESTPSTAAKDEITRYEQENLVKKEAEIHGAELMRLGYTLPHVVYTYGTLCQSINELAEAQNVSFTKEEFQNLNRCLDIAIAAAITGHELSRSARDTHREIERLGYLAHELRNALSSVNISLQLIKKGTAGFNGTTGQVLGKSLKRIEEIIERSLTEVKLHMEPKIIKEPAFLLQVVDQIVMTAEIEAHAKNQRIEVRIEPTIIINADQHLFYSALSNIIQNAIKYTRQSGLIQIRANQNDENVVIEVEDECGGLTKPANQLFKPFEQFNKDRKGIGLGLTIAQRAIILNKGTIEAINLDKKGCIFRITLPRKQVEANIEQGPSEQSLNH